MAERTGTRREEFERLVLPQLDSLLGLALTLTRRREDAEDLVQDAVVRAFRFFESYAPGTQLKAWLFRILRNVFIDRYRAARARPPEIELAASGRDDEPGIERSAEELFLAGELDPEVGAALAALPEVYRTVVWLALVEELPYKEIGVTLGVPTGTVMSRLHRGRRMLQAALLELARRRGILRAPPPVVPDGGGAR